MTDQMINKGLKEIQEWLIENGLRIDKTLCKKHDEFINLIDDLLNEAYEAGHEDGLKKGFTQGYDEGYDQGFEDGSN